jgi:gamma-glutamyl-gamma-aminobutyrate hydrolase PuuD
MKDFSSRPETGDNKFDAEDFQRSAGGCCFNCKGPCEFLLRGNKTVSSRRKRAAKIMAAAKAGPPKPEPEVLNRTVITVAPERKVMVQKDHIIPYPELYMEVFITEPGAEMFMAEMFARARCSQAKSLDQADLVVFTGGPDVNPSLYNETPHKETKFNRERDERDTIYYVEALKARVPMFGVCRGSQFLHVMQGGKLIQHIGDKKHLGDHPIMDKSGILENKYLDRVPSTHHQAVIPKDGMEVLASVYRSEERWFNKDVCERGARLEDVEAYFYKQNCILGVQGHPEYRGYSRYTNYCLRLIEEKIVGGGNVSLERGKYRVKRDVVILDKQ